MRDSHHDRQLPDWLYHYHRVESDAVLFEKTAHYAIQLMCWADQMEQSGLRLHAFNMAPAVYEVLISGPAERCQPALHRALGQFLQYREQSGAAALTQDLQTGDWAITQYNWAKYAKQALDARSRDSTGATVISSWHYPQCSLLSSLGSSPAAGRAQPMVDTRLRPLRLD